MSYDSKLSGMGKSNSERLTVQAAQSSFVVDELPTFSQSGVQCSMRLEPIPNPNSATQSMSWYPFVSSQGHHQGKAVHQVPRTF